MPENWTVQEVAARTVGGTPYWEVAALKPDGTLHRHIMPTSTLEWRAAEYGIDPADVDTLLEVALHEPHIPMVDDPAGPRYTDGGVTLLTAENDTEARTAHLARIKACPVSVRVRGAKPLDTVRAGHKPDAARIKAMREAVDTNRWLRKYGDLPALPRLAPGAATAAFPTRFVPARRP